MNQDVVSDSSQHNGFLSTYTYSFFVNEPNPLKVILKSGDEEKYNFKKVTYSAFSSCN